MTDLQRRIGFTLGALAAYRLGAHIPVPGIDPEILAVTVAIRLTSLSIFALGVVPYLTAAFLMRLASAISPRLRSLEYRSPAGRQKVVQATRLLAVLLAAMQAFGLAISLESAGLATDPGLVFRIVAVGTITGGFVAVMWLADQITRHGIGNGVALILFAGIVANLPAALASYLEFSRTGELPFGVLIGLLLLVVAVVAAIVFVERAVRHVLVRYPRQRVGDRTFGGQSATISLKLNNGGIIPAVIAMWLLTMAMSLVGFAVVGGDSGWMDPWRWRGHPAFLATSAALIIAMTYVYSVALLDPKETAGRLQDKGAFALDAQPGVETEHRFRQLLRCLSLIGGVYLAVIYLSPEILYAFMPVLPGQIGGIGFLIAVAVAMDTLSDLAHRLHRNGGGKAPSEAVAIVMDIPDRPRVSSAGR